MTDMQCCGVSDYRDFEAAPMWNATRGDRVVPEPCCKRLPTANGTTALLDAACPQQPTAENSNFMTVSENTETEWSVVFVPLVLMVRPFAGLLRTGARVAGAQSQRDHLLDGRHRCRRAAADLPVVLPEQLDQQVPRDATVGVPEHSPAFLLSSSLFLSISLSLLFSV